MRKIPTPLRSGLAAVLFILLLGLTGCGSKPGTIAGKVTFQGKPVPSGSVILFCADQQIVRGIIGPDGSYSIANVPRGLAQITVRAHSHVPEGFQLRQKLPPSQNGPIQATAEEVQGRAVAIPEHYGLPEESGLSLRVDKVRQSHDIELVP